VLRYHGAFGPAPGADVTTWCRLTGLREVVERLRPQLRPFRDERGRELFDLPDAPRPGPDVPSPPRFLPEYDNVLLSHADRTRFQAVGPPLPWPAGGPHGSVLHDGVVAATWSIERADGPGAATLVLHHRAGLAKRALAAIAAEGRRFLRFHEPTATTHDVRPAPVG
jgi:hypothetical protein